MEASASESTTESSADIGDQAETPESTETSASDAEFSPTDPYQSGDGCLEPEPDSQGNIAPPTCPSSDNWTGWIEGSVAGSERGTPGGSVASGEEQKAGGSASGTFSEISALGWEAGPFAGRPPPCDIASEKCLKKKANTGDRKATFLLAQMYFDTNRYDEARDLFLAIAAENIFAQYQLGVMFFEGLGFEQDAYQGFRLMLRVALSVGKNTEQHRTIHKAQYNIARAYFNGCGTMANEDDAKRWLDRAAADGNDASVKAQTMLAMWFARKETRDLAKSFFWHSEATGNGSLESQGALGVYYLYGLGIRRDLIAARFCLREAALRGNVYAAGHLAFFYYTFRFYMHAVCVGRQLARLAERGEPARLARDSDCLEKYVRRGIAIGCFVLSQCMLRGYGGLASDEDGSHRVGALAVQMDIEATSDLQQMTMNGPWLDWAWPHLCDEYAILQ